MARLLQTPVRTGALALVLAAITWAALGSAAAQDAAVNYPSRPIRIIVGFTAGGGNDILARLVGQKLSESLGQAVVIENKPGAGAIIGTEYVKGQAADGYTLLMGASGAMTINPAVYTKLPYSTQRDFVPISMVASFPFLLLVNPATPVKSVAELVAYAKANPDKANYGSSSPAFQLTAELFKQRTFPTRAATSRSAPWWQTRCWYRSSMPHRPRARSPPARCGRSQSRPASAARSSPTCRRSPRPVSRTWRSRSGAGCSRPPERRLRSSASCRTKCGASCGCRTSRNG